MSINVVESTNGGKRFESLVGVFRKLRQFLPRGPSVPSVKPASPEHPRKAKGENGNSQAQLNQATATRVLGLVRKTRQSQPSLPDVPAPQTCSVKQETPNHHPASDEQLRKAVGENAFLQGQLNQVFAGRLLELQNNALLQGQLNQAIASRLLRAEPTASQPQETLQALEKLVRDLSGRIESLAVSSASWGRTVVPVGDGLLLTRVLHGFLMYLEATDMSVTPCLAMRGYWEKCLTAAFLSRLKCGMTVVDVGANCGYYTLLAASMAGPAGRVYSFEPNPRTFELLMKNIHVNWYGAQVQAYQLAVSDSKKQAELHVLRNFQASSSLFVPELVPESDSPREQHPVVEAVPLDDVIQERVDLMKIDAEGSEPLIFEGMRGILDRSPNLAIFMEFNIPMIRKSVDPRSFLKRIRESGFSLQWITPWDTLEPFEEERAMQFPMFNLLLERN